MPHCYVRVVPSPAGICPSCNKNINDHTGASIDFTRLVISPRDALPPNCYLCNSPATRRIKVRRSVVTGSGVHPIVAVLTFLLSLPLGMIRIFHSGNRYTYSIVIHLPQCKGCASTKEPQPEFVDLEQGAMTFIVHKSFAGRVSTQNRSNQ